MREVRTFLPTSLMRKFSVNAISADLWPMHLKTRGAENFLTRAFCGGACTFRIGMSAILVILSSNFTRKMLHRACFPVCSLHDSPSFQGHLYFSVIHLMTSVYEYICIYYVLLLMQQTNLKHVTSIFIQIRLKRVPFLLGTAI